MFDFYQNIPQYIDPIVFLIGSFAIRWYSLSYLVGIVVVFLLLRWRIEEGEGRDIFLGSGFKIRQNLFDFLIVVFWGMLLGGRLGYVLFYNFEFFRSNPLAIISPFNVENGEYVGIFGMSYHGALIGMIIFSYIFSKIKKIDFWKIADFVAPAIAGAYFFGRIGNFLNGELFGRPTDFFLGMYFSSDTFLRHPSQLYEAFFEGIVLFFALWLFRNRSKFRGQIFLFYVMGYAGFRFFLEYYRSPDQQIGLVGGIFSIGQLLSIGMLIAGIFLYFQENKKNAII